MSETKILPDFKDVCVKCHRSLDRLLMMALLSDLGASVSPSVLDCDHEFKGKKGNND